MSYPEHDKLDAHGMHATSIIRFLHWLFEEREPECELARFGDGDYGMYPTNERVEDLVYEYYGTDAKKLEAERVAMIEECRKADTR